METILNVENLKCGGCENSIKKTIGAMLGVSEVRIEREQGMVSVCHDDRLSVADLKQELYSMGYPEKGSTEGLDKWAAQAKSYVSCAIGKIG